MTLILHLPGKAHHLLLDTLGSPAHAAAAFEQASNPGNVEHQHRKATARGTGCCLSRAAKSHSVLSSSLMRPTEAMFALYLQAVELAVIISCCAQSLRTQASSTRYLRHAWLSNTCAIPIWKTTQHRSSKISTCDVGKSAMLAIFGKVPALRCLL